MARKKVVWHLIPTMNYGGVEVGIVKSYQQLCCEFNYKIVVLSGKNEINNIPISSLWTFISKVRREDTIIVSLWKTYLIGIVLSFLRFKVLPFIHHSGNVHLVANLITRFTTVVLSEGIADSSASSTYYNTNYHIAPYVFSIKEMNSNLRDIDVIWVGRDADQKRFDLSMQVMSQLSNSGYNVLSIIATNRDYGFEHPCLINCNTDEVIRLLSRSKVYMQLSVYEGFSMSTAEAIMSGCRPFVTPVGEIEKYLDKKYFVESVQIESIISELHAILEEGTGNVKARVERLSSYGSYIETLKKVLNEI